jgi:hypothetical protein
LTDTVPIIAQNVKIPSMNPKSASRLQTNALFAAAAALSFVNQNPISRYELSPTPSQKKNIMIRFVATTMPVIENMKSDIPPKNRARPGSCAM